MLVQTAESILDAKSKQGTLAEKANRTGSVAEKKQSIKIHGSSLAAETDVATVFSQAFVISQFEVSNGKCELFSYGNNPKV